MSFLSLLYAFGIFSVALPLIFHLIRRTPRGRYAFGSLMFLSSSPPRLTRRSRIDNWLLLLLRALALTLLALAFSRPFLRVADNLSLGSVRGRRIAILLDTSASMRRGDLWNQAVRQARAELAALEPADDVALFAFDRHPRSLVDFDELQQVNQHGKATLVEDQLKTLTPSWATTDLGAALVMVADAIDVARDRNQSDAATEIVLISDLQQGALVTALQSYEWPQNILVSVRPVSPINTTNASLRLLESEDGADTDPRVRIFNAANSSSDQFYVGWETSETRADIVDDIAITVPPGQSRVVRVPRPQEAGSFDRVVLRGDDHPFDNIFYTVPIENQSVTVVYIGDDEDGDPEGLRYFLEAALQGIPYCDVSLVTRRQDEKLDLDPEQPPRMIVVAQPVNAEQMEDLKSYLAAGGSCLIVPTSHDAAVQLTSFSKTVEVLADRPSRRAGDYVMLSEIDFGHPVFAEFASADYNDFTKIHFWNHFRFTLAADETTRVFARFDDGYPALWEQSYEDGTLYVLTSGWRIRDSQLALSSRFVPLIMGLMEQAGGGRTATPALTIHQSIELPPAIASADARVIKPDATSLPLAQGLKRFDDTDEPGLYEVTTTTTPFRFAVNLDPGESDTARMDIEQLEQYGLRLGKQSKQSEEIERERQLRDTELEDRQKIWRWLIVVVLCLVTFETWLAGRKSVAGSEQTGDQA
jgi:hypothetical protein